MSTARSQAERAYDQVTEWSARFEPLEDIRGKAWRPLDEVLLVCLIAVPPARGSTGAAPG